MAENLYHLIGGKPAVQATVTLMYEKILQDDLLSPFFEDIDVDTLRKSQSAFVTMAFGGPTNYTGKNLRDAHAPMIERGLSDVHFDAVARHLKHSMEELNVPANLIRMAMDIIEVTRDDVLNR